jgi:NodT family efflux transporter outer membrane factor (OMF) lipoprotein
MTKRSEILSMLIRAKIWQVFFLLGITFFVSSCKVTQLGKFPEIRADISLYRELGISDSTGIALVKWHDLFTDTCLQSIIEKAINNNPDIQVAIARVKKADAAFRQSRAEFFPSLNAGANATFQSESGGFGVPESYQIFGSTSWEADIWGKFRSAKRASLASLMASEAFKRAVATDLVASVAINYYNLLTLDSQLEITRKTLEKRISNTETMEALRDNDLITSADLVLSQANRYATEIIIPDLIQRIYETENILSLLMGQVPGPIERTSLEQQDLSEDLRTGVPAQLLANRPDVIQAEYRLRYYYETARSARTNFYPSLTINARGGLTQTNLNDLFNQPVFFWNIIGGLVQPIFNYGLNRQRFLSATADFEESQASFRKILLNAGSEVVNAMHSYETATNKISIRGKQIGYLEKAVDYTTELLKYTSTTSYIDVLTSEVNLLSAQLNGVNDKFQQLQSIVALYQSLGGGWK